MKLFRSMVDYISGRLVSHLVHEGSIEAGDRKATVAVVAAAITEDLMVEDRLNEEVREIMSKYADEMTRTGVQYHEMFKKIKGELVRQRKLILQLADPGARVKLSHEKTIHLSHVIVKALEEAEGVRLLKEQNDVRLDIVRLLKSELRTDAEIDLRVRHMITSQKRDIPEGSEEFDILYRKYYESELNKLRDVKA